MRRLINLKVVNPFVLNTIKIKHKCKSERIRSVIGIKHDFLGRRITKWSWKYIWFLFDFNPSAAEKADQIDQINDRIYNTLNNGVYKCGFATTQQAYEEALVPLFDTLDFLEEQLSTNSYLVGEEQTEADWRLFTTLIRFDAVYFGHFKCNM